MSLITEYLSREPVRRRAQPHDSHPGESLGKQECRAAVYRELCAVPPTAPGVILAGPNPGAEFDAIADAGWTMGMVVAVDSSIAAVRGLVACADAGCRAVSGDAADVLAGMDRVAWFCGDFMGLGRRAVLAAQLAVERLIPGGALSLTYCLGRGDSHSAVAIAAEVGRGGTRAARVHDGLGKILRYGVARDLRAVYCGGYCRPRGMAMGVSVWRIGNRAL